MSDWYFEPDGPEQIEKIIQEAIATDDADWGAGTICDRINDRMKAEREKAPVFKLTIDKWGIHEWTDSGPLGTLEPTHRARLDGIEPL